MKSNLMAVWGPALRLFADGVRTPAPNTRDYDRYAPCPCDSGKKFKWCCEQKVRDRLKAGPRV